MLMKVLKRIGILLLALVVGGGLGYALAFVWENGWFEGWTRVAAAPEAIASLRAINGSAVWVEAQSGTLYHNAVADVCETGCWVRVPEAPVEFVPDPEINQVFTEACVSPPPLLGAVERKAECQRADWVDFNTVYARRGSGALVVWRFTSGGEWVFVTYMLGIFGGAVSLFVLILVSMLLQGLLRWLSRRAAMN